MVLLHVTLFGICLWPRRQRRVPPAVEVAAVMGLVAATSLRVWAIRSLGSSWNVTAHVDPATTVVTSGPYRWMRHPNYTAVALEFACLPLAVGALPDAVLLSIANAAVLVPRIRDEEQLLDALPAYRESFAGVPRFVPLPGRHSRQVPARDSQSRTVSRPNPM
ncbi:MAG: hypothetical protein JOZ92_10495 [Candidatus Dormibacteraeota bacterium]|nr:hypothetical protein [Candidatus Dormibacteraeota bacterium]